MKTRLLRFNERTGIWVGQGGGGSGLTSDTSDPSVPVTRLSSDGGLM